MLFKNKLLLRRRLLFKFVLFIPIILYAFKKEEKIWKVLEESADIIFPASKYSKNAKELGVIIYLKEAINSKYFSKRERKIILNGAQELERRYTFLSLDMKNREKAIKEFSKDGAGRAWLVVYTKYILEGVFCHPIYGGNKNREGWIAFHFIGGVPEPKRRYALGRV